MTGNVYAILGGQDGVGATTTAVALGASLAETAHRVAVIDADFEAPGVDGALELGDPDRTLRDVLRGDADLDDALVETAHGLQVLPSGDAAPAPTDVRSHALVRAADRVRDRFDVVLVDLGAAGGTAAAIALERADGAILTATPEDDAIAAVADVATVAHHHGADVLGTAFTQVHEETEIDPGGAADAIGTDVLAMIPDDDAVAQSAAEGASLLRHDPDSPAAMVYWEFAAKLADGDVGDEPVVHEPVTEESADEGSTSTEQQHQESADDPDRATEQESSRPDSRPDEQRRSSASDATPHGPEGADGAPSDDAEPVAPPAPNDAEAQSASSPASTSSRQDAESRSDSSPDSSSPRRDADERSSSSPRSQTHEDAGGRDASSEPSIADAHEDAGSRETASDTQDRVDDDAADESTSERDSTPPDDSAIATGSEPDGERGGEPSRNEFSWENDPIDSDETGSGDEPSLDDESVLGEEHDGDGTEADDEAGSEPNDGVEHAESDDADERDGEDESDDDDDVDAAFKATMDKVREQREEEAEDDEDDEDDDGGMFGIGN